MDPQLPESFNHRYENLPTGRTYHFVDQQPDGYDPKRHPTLLLVHGFPDLWYGWRYQIGPWVRRGCRVVAPDMLGYGASSKPVDPAEYSTKRLCADLAALLDVLGIKKAVLIGHDWGAFAVGRFALWYPDRLLALIMMSVPYTPPSRVFIPITEVARLAPNLGYQVYFANPKSGLEILANLRKFLRIIFSVSDSDLDFASLEENPCLLNDKEFEYYHSEHQNGMFGPLNYYRTSKFRHEEEQDFGLGSNLRPDLPFLFMWGTKDPTGTPAVIAKSKKFIVRYQDIALEGRGHWLMIEAKDEVTELIANWLKV
ncbi:Alpha/Beta hydrolase protein [Gymnopilus junonius]|uniref:Alpha/Beta hydrolase protein n=1 Tax=Gymnopilus junonius TaxID=109634 RepID=A0A9P5NZ83_GYMJU|nr:Alpha/Beta hydrolase protein [Gymnopilus junonius]